MRPTRFYSKKQENTVAKNINGRVVSNSGATPFNKGDVLTDKFLIECKTKISSSQSFSIRKEWLEKNKEEAFAMGKQYSTLAFNFGPDEPNYYVLDERTFKQFIYLLGQEEN